MGRNPRAITWTGVRCANQASDAARGATVAATASSAAASRRLLKLAVLELRNRAGVTDDEAYYLTDKVRDAASGSLAQTGFLIMTRENIVDLLPPGKDLAKCSDASCEVEIGREIGADYVVTGEILRFAGELRANIKAHRTLSGAFVGAETAGGKSLRELEKSISETAIAICRRISTHLEAEP